MCPSARLSCTDNRTDAIVGPLRAALGGHMSTAVRRSVYAAITLLLIGSIATAWQGWLGGGPQALLMQFWAVFAGFVAVYYELFDRIGKVLAPLVAIGSGGYAIYQKWHFAGRNMHLRLQEFLAREETRLRDADRTLDRSALRPSPGRPFQAPIFEHAALRAALSQMDWGTLTLTTLHWSRMRRAEQEVQRATDELQEQLNLWEKRRADYQRRLIQAHLVKGALSVVRAARIREAGGDDREETQAALTEFERAVDVNPNTPHPLAIELAAHQRVRLGDFTGGSIDFARLVDLPSNTDQPFARARALRFQAEIHECRNGGTQPNVTAANQALKSAIELIPAPRARADVLEAAELHETQGRVRSKRPNWDWDDAALTSYTTAEGLYLQVNGAEAAAALERIAQARRNILARRAPQPNGQGEPPHA
jgi:hypothetical protein